ncbi:MAG TPA: TPM domain-containing protein [Phenylobacterium sp.]|jgi:uncharacterized protein|uniref:TPM domain-containing protein n=1 Tax=Phenylobacterium sp. TaxID=1871053 RepID=UPI002C595672|nr:TPM domain-containing protein [Phenylobacterium sp.]HXA39300.1 TPM domain-containing protein [Phenylobacterium sp.]
MATPPPSASLPPPPHAAATGEELGRKASGNRIRNVCAAVLAFFAIAGVAFAATPKFPALSGRVVDEAHVLSPAATQKLDGELASLEQQTGHQLVVATVPDLQGFPIEDYGYQLGRAWQLGRKGVNDGAILLVAPKDHKVRIEVGYGLEPVLTDALSSVILQEKVLPQFKQGHMEQGVVAGAEALIAQLSLPDEQAKANVAQAQAQPRPQADRGAAPHIPVFLILLIVFWVIAGLLRAGGRGFGGAWWLLPFFLGGGGRGGGWGGGGGGGGFSGGGGSFGGGGSSGSW